MIFLLIPYAVIAILVAVVQFCDLERKWRTAFGLGLWWPLTFASFAFKGTLDAFGIMFFGDES